MLIAVQYVVSAVALILLATYYLLASIPFAYYHFLQFPHFWWLPIFITFPPGVFAVALALALPRSRAVATPLRPWIRYVAIAGVTTTACMAAVGFAPVLLTSEIAATLAFLPLAFLTAASGITIAGATSGVNETTPLRPDGAAVCSVAAIAGLLIGVAYAAESAARGAALTLGRTEFATAAAVSIAAHTICFAGAALVVASARRFARRWANRSVEAAAAAVCAAVAVAVLVRRSLLSALILSDSRAALVAMAVGLAVVSAIWAANTGTRRSPRPPRGFSAAVALTALGVLIVVLPRMIVLADWGGTLQKILVVFAWVAAVTFVAGTSFRIRRTAIALVVVFAAASTAVAARHPNPGAREQRPLDLSLAVDRYATFDASLGVLLDVFHPMVSDGNYFSTLRAAGDATDDRSL